MTTDVILDKSKGYYDISFDATTGDIATAQSFDTAILMSIFCEARAASSEVAASHQRRGWIGNESTPGIEMGGKLWEFYQSKITGSMLSELGVVLTNSLLWLVEQGYAISVNASAAFTNNEVQATVIFQRAGSVPEKKLYTLWNNTGAHLS